MSKKRAWRNREASMTRWLRLAIRTVKAVAKREGYPPEEDSTGKARDRAYVTVRGRVQEQTARLPRGGRGRIVRESEANASLEAWKSGFKEE